MHYANQGYQEAGGKLFWLWTSGYFRKNWVSDRQHGRCSVILNYTWLSFINTPSLLHWTNKQTSVFGCFCFRVKERDTNLTMICPSSLLVFWACDWVGSGCECRTGVPWGPPWACGRAECHAGWAPRRAGCTEAEPRPAAARPLSHIKAAWQDAQVNSCCVN